jgi:hypothetical protein
MPTGSLTANWRPASECRVCASAITGSPSAGVGQHASRRYDTLPVGMIYYCASSILILFLSAAMASADSVNTNSYSQTNIRLTEANGGSSIEIGVGTNLNIFLKTSPEDIYKVACYWSKITVSDASVLKEVQKLVLLPTGVTAAFFRAVRPGLVRIDSFRRNCSNGGVIRWQVEVRVAE